MRLRDLLGIRPATQRRIARVLELALVGLFFVGLDRGNTGIVVNTAIGLAVTNLVPLLERDYGIPMDPALTLWITGAVFFHALGTVGLPGGSASFYRTVWWWDHVTHTLSASVVAAAGYATARALDRHSDAVSFPREFVFVFILLFVIAFGVLWEVIEFAVGGFGVLTQYGLEDTMLDLVFDTVGGVVVALWGTAYLTDVAGALAERFESGTGCPPGFARPQCVGRHGLRETSGSERSCFAPAVTDAHMEFPSQLRTCRFPIRNRTTTNTTSASGSVSPAPSTDD